MGICFYNGLYFDKGVVFKCANLGRKWTQSVLLILEVSCPQIIRQLFSKLSHSQSYLTIFLKVNNRMLKGGKPKEPIWRQFDMTDDHIKVRCKRCRASISAKADCLRTRTKKCPVQADAVSSQVAVALSPFVSASPKKHPASDVSTEPQPKKVQVYMQGHAITTPAVTKDKCTAEFVYD